MTTNGARYAMMTGDPRTRRWCAAAWVSLAEKLWWTRNLAQEPEAFGWTRWSALAPSTASNIVIIPPGESRTAVIPKMLGSDVVGSMDKVGYGKLNLASELLRNVHVKIDVN